MAILREPKIYLKILLNLGIFVLTVLFFLYVLPKLLVFFIPFVIGWLISVVANPLVRFMEKRIKIVRKHGSVIIIIVVLAIVITVLYFAITIIGRQAMDLISNFPDIYGSIGIKLNEAAEKLNGIYQVMPIGVQNFVDNIMLNFEQYVQNFMNSTDGPTISDASHVARNVADILFISVITILSAYFFIAERDDLIASVKRMVPRNLTERYNLVMSNFKMAVGGYFKAQFKIMLVLIVIMVIGFEIIKVEYGILLALGIAFLDFLPVFGTGAVFWPWAFIDLITGNYFRAVGLMIIYMVCLLVKQLLQPKMVGDSIGLSPLMTLFFLFVGYRLKGVMGMIIGIPVGMVLVNLYRAGLFSGVIEDFKIVYHDINEFRKFRK